MQISPDESLRLEFNNRDNFVDVRYVSGYEHYALAFSAIDNFGFYALVRHKDGRYGKEELIVFPNKTWFNEWLKKVDVEILYLSTHSNRKEVL
jgi:hypothetical protein